jgi:hypothetical protein
MNAPANRWMLVAALMLFLLVLGVSRLEDNGGERNRVNVELSVAPDRLELTYGPTRYPYIWVIAIGPDGRARALIENKHPAPEGETLSLPRPPERTNLVCHFFAVPKTLEQIQAALDRGVQLPGLRFAWVVNEYNSALLW